VCKFSIDGIIWWQPGGRQTFSIPPPTPRQHERREVARRNKVGVLSPSCQSSNLSPVSGYDSPIVFWGSRCLEISFSSALQRVPRVLVSHQWRLRSRQHAQSHTWTQRWDDAYSTHAIPSGQAVAGKWHVILHYLTTFAPLSGFRVTRPCVRASHLACVCLEAAEVLACERPRECCSHTLPITMPIAGTYLPLPWSLCLVACPDCLR
jgi:hypothetical protein